jgi:hypothetical protein
VKPGDRVEVIASVHSWGPKVGQQGRVAGTDYRQPERTEVVFDGIHTCVSVRTDRLKVLACATCGCKGRCK